ncbi:hypothetical protein F4Z98_02250 [Candidatus Poribacteria bacterium]|nr:hypothetical protein [Candidatus Poribacteria bacterium]MYC39516.1 hypothetical protein [Candidatus Dadabacteria bacterium]
MAVDIKKMVDAICNLTVLDLCALVKALRKKFGLKTSDTIRSDLNEPEEADASEDGSTEAAEESTKSEKESKSALDEPGDEIEDTEAESVVEESAEVTEAEAVAEESIKSESDSSSVEPGDEPGDEPIDEIEDAEAETVADGATEVEEKLKKSEEESKPAPDPSSVPDPGPSARVRKPSPVKRFKGKDFAFVYAWRYFGDKRHVKIGETTKKSFHSRYVKTYHPTDDPILIGIFKCNNKPHAQDVETYILKKLTRTRPDIQGHEWVKIDEAFNKMIDDSFISDPDELKKIFGSNIKTEKL